MTGTHRRPLGGTGLSVSPVALGTNTFGWSADEDAAFAVLDAYVAAGGNLIDTAHTYPAWAPGCEGGESETIIGRWLAARPGVRERLVIATKVGMAGGRFEKGLQRSQIIAWVDGCLSRLGIDRIDVLYTHEDDLDTPLSETLGALNELVESGVVAHVGASNLSPERLSRALAMSASNGWARYAVLQPAYNLVRRSEFERRMQGVCNAEGVSVVPYPALAGGFLTGKYRPGIEPPPGVRAPGAQRLADSPLGQSVLTELDRVASERSATLAQVALAWLMSRATIASVLVSATLPSQVDEFMAACAVRLSADQITRLDAASARA